MAVVIYNCKACKKGKRVAYPERDKGRATWFRVSPGEGRVYPGHLDHYARGRRYHYGDGVCEDCGRAMTWGFLRGFVKPEIRCDARCTNARGFNCECSCGGENHGCGSAIAGAGLFTGLLLAA